MIYFIIKWKSRCQTAKGNFESRDEMPYENLMTIEELAEYLRVKKRTIYDWVKKKKIPAVKAVGQWRFKKDSIDAWLDRQR